MEHDVCVFGGCSVDFIFYKDDHGIIPNKPSLITFGGKGSNQAIAAARAGVKVTMISRIGNDEIGQKIIDNLVYNNVSVNNIELVPNLQNDYSNIVVDNINKDNEISRFGNVIDSFTVDMIDTYKEVFRKSKFVVSQMKAPKEVIVELINYCSDNKIPIIVTPCRPNKLVVSEKENQDLIEKITFITANKEECIAMFNCKDIEKCVSLYPNKLIVTLGNEGVIYHNGIKVVHYPSVNVLDVEDTTGAGDTFNGNLIASLVNGYSLDDAIIRAQYAASISIKKKGAQQGMPYKQELDQYIANIEEL